MTKPHFTRTTYTWKIKKNIFFSFKFGNWNIFGNKNNNNNNDDNDDYYYNDDSMTLLKKLQQTI